MMSRGSRSNEMADMDGIERAAQDAQPLDHRTSLPRYAIRGVAASARRVYEKNCA
jgi:hypothetical protein